MTELYNDPTLPPVFYQELPSLQIPVDLSQVAGVIDYVASFIYRIEGEEALISQVYHPLDEGIEYLNVSPAFFGRGYNYLLRAYDVFHQRLAEAEGTVDVLLTSDRVTLFSS